VMRTGLAHQGAIDVEEQKGRGVGGHFFYDSGPRIYLTCYSFRTN
jgi:hypothetical protein